MNSSRPKTGETALGYENTLPFFLAISENLEFKILINYKAKIIDLETLWNKIA